MKQLVQKQLAQSIATMQAVLADESIADTLATIGELTANAMRSGHKLPVAGNGGSAADAQHLVAEFVVRLYRQPPRITRDSADCRLLHPHRRQAATSASKPSSPRQIEALGQPGDVFLGISTSGNSKNIINALQQAKKQNITTIGFTGGTGGQMLTLCDHNVVIPSNVTMNIQESHLALEHIFYRDHRALLLWHLTSTLNPKSSANSSPPPIRVPHLRRAFCG